jgi:hypothetical protein
MKPLLTTLLLAIADTGAASGRDRAVDALGNSTLPHTRVAGHDAVPAPRKQRAAPGFGSTFGSVQ